MMTCFYEKKKKGVTMSVKIKPSLGRILVKVTKQSKDDSGIFLPIDDSKKVQKGEVISIGVMKNDEKYDILVGDYVYFTKYSGDSILENSGENYIIIKNEEIIGVENGK